MNPVLLRISAGHTAIEHAAIADQEGRSIIAEIPRR